MKIFRRLQEIPRFPGGSCVAIGNFDGVHTGHQELILRLLEQKNNIPEVILTFQRHPRITLEDHFEKSILTEFDEKMNIFRTLGIKYIIALSFQRWRTRQPEAFIRSVLIKSLSAREIYMGQNFRFGQNRAGNIKTLKKFQAEGNFHVSVIRYKKYKNVPVSSTRIREHLYRGEVEEARVLLGRPFHVSGRVIRGERRGRTLGFPTANIQTRELPIRHGVYGVRVTTRREVFRAIANYGIRPTFQPSDPHLEIFIPCLTKNLYRERMDVDFLSFIRPERKFRDGKKLVHQIKKDLQSLKNK